MNPSSIPELQHQEHKTWLSNIDFYQDQIKIFQKELAMVLHQHHDAFSIIEHVDEYREILLKKLKTLDEIRRQIILHEKRISKDNNSVSIDIWDHYEVRRQMNEFEKKFDEIKGSFRKFVARQINIGKP